MLNKQVYISPTFVDNEFICNEDLVCAEYLDS